MAQSTSMSRILSLSTQSVKGPDVIVGDRPIRKVCKASIMQIICGILIFFNAVPSFALVIVVVIQGLKAKRSRRVYAKKSCLILTRSPKRSFTMDPQLAPCLPIPVLSLPIYAMSRLWTYGGVSSSQESQTIRGSALFGVNHRVIEDEVHHTITSSKLFFQEERVTIGIFERYRWLSRALQASSITFGGRWLYMSVKSRPPTRPSRESSELLHQVQVQAPGALNLLQDHINIYKWKGDKRTKVKTIRLSSRPQRLEGTMPQRMHCSKSLWALAVADVVRNYPQTCRDHGGSELFPGCAWEKHWGWCSTAAPTAPLRSPLNNPPKLTKNVSKGSVDSV
ncbi:uncharacterized protein NECHADRAFT_81946 [Fusarium vanettenii 77-13-4]|uniref:Uncharacterized protein n=1 Tax=Fusarium vanettenii (strain ATCC MYA-4622 / CBS 123669 / FGSC 9596 / NRRL 45880 / 77-13-4) TaxID=660122 RepID=C7ZA21_FUSV7|nr:uncharacterized protein NECHADRAFT_81946 [Fusarium vanettenii 77-13-4]EEU39198.1 predicted protein [Fusarium vanettenii 77-13-4]